jgi:nicotinamide-nucleotide amidase
LNIELINTGSELLLGRVLNTHQHWLGRELADLGYSLNRQVTVPDTGIAIQEAVREALTRADLIITTGGLGPTSDDVTRDLIAALLGRKLIQDAETLARIESFFTRRRRPMPASTSVQAMVPEGATILTNEHGTAPGLVLAVNPNPYRPGGGQAKLVMLPGPPRELRPMFTNQVVPWLREWFPQPGFVCRTLRTTGLGESYLEEMVAGPLKPLTDAGLELGYCARVGEVDLRFVARGPQAVTLAAEAEQIVRAKVGAYIFGENDDLLEAVIVKRLTELKRTVALAESCTGGYIGNRLTNVSGASAVFLAGFITYSNEAKTKFIGVPAELIAQHGAVSEPVARAMAEGARAVSGADYALAVTGIAGPTGGTEEKPVGTVHMALAQASGVTTYHRINQFDRETFKYVTSQQILEMLRRAIV